MVYKPNVPQPTDIVGQSADDFRNNFIAVQGGFEENHTSLIDVNEDKRGKHHKITFVDQSVDPTTAADETAIFGVTDTPVAPAVSRTDLWVRPEGSGAKYKIWSDQHPAQGQAAGPQGGIKLEAYVAFDPANGQIYQREIDVLNEHGTPVPTKFDNKSPNIASIGTSGTQDRWEINFDPVLSTDDVFVDIRQFWNDPLKVNLIPKIALSYGATWASSVTTAQIKINSIELKNGLQIRVVNAPGTPTPFTSVVYVAIWTAA